MASIACEIASRRRLRPLQWIIRKRATTSWSNWSRRRLWRGIGFVGGQKLPRFFVARLVEKNVYHPRDRKFILLNFQSVGPLDNLLSSFGLLFVPSLPANQRSVWCVTWSPAIYIIDRIFNLVLLNHGGCLFGGIFWSLRCWYCSLLQVNFGVKKHV
jgi:hypothetical protein